MSAATAATSSESLADTFGMMMLDNDPIMKALFAGEMSWGDILKRRSVAVSVPPLVKPKRPLSASSVMQSSSSMLHVTLRVTLVSLASTSLRVSL